jgi:TM2 domain-containing membrane protein YozV
MDEICPHCGHRSLEINPRFCSACGGRVGGSSTPAGSGSETRHEDEKNPQIAVFCSSIIPGLGQVYNGESHKDLALRLGTHLGLFLILIPGLVVWIYSMYDAYLNAEKMNEGTVESRPLQPVQIVLFVVAAVFIVIAVILTTTMIIISRMLSQLSPAGNVDFFQIPGSNG